jgi:cell division protein FtsX
MTRKWLVAAGTCSVAAVAVGAGVFVLAKDEPRKRTDCLVRVFFKQSASRNQIGAVGARLGAIDDVALRFVSKEQALVIMRKRYPELAPPAGINPLPDAYEATTTYADSCSEVRAAVHPRPAGVETAKAAIRPYRNP